MLVLDFTTYAISYPESALDLGTAMTQDCDSVSAGPTEETNYMFFDPADDDDGLNGMAAASRDPARDYQHMYFCVDTTSLEIRPISAGDVDSTGFKKMDIMDFQREVQSLMGLNCYKQYDALATSAPRAPSAKIPSKGDMSGNPHLCENDRTGKRNCWCNSPETCCCYNDDFGRNIFRSRAGFSTEFFPSRKHTMLIANPGEQAYCTVYMMCQDTLWTDTWDTPEIDTAVSEVPRAFHPLGDVINLSREYPDKIVHNGVDRANLGVIDQDMINTDVAPTGESAWEKKPDLKRDLLQKAEALKEQRELEGLRGFPL